MGEDEEERPWSARLFEPRRPAYGSLDTDYAAAAPSPPGWPRSAHHVLAKPSVHRAQVPPAPRVPAAFADTTVEPCASQLCEDSHPPYLHMPPPPQYV